MAEIPEEYCGGPDISRVTSSYGEGKRLSEMLFRTAGIDQRTARVFSLTGPYQDLTSSFAVPDLIRQAGEKEFLQLTSDGSAVRSYCYVADLSAFLFKVLLGEPDHDVYNVGCREGTATIGEVARALALIFGGLEVREAFQVDGSSPRQNRYVPRLDRMDEVYSPRIGLREGLLRTCHSLYNRGLIGRRPVGGVPEWRPS
jgi:nucleoside-diphosphate-sugar epimerase